MVGCAWREPWLGRDKPRQSNILENFYTHVDRRYFEIKKMNTNTQLATVETMNIGTMLAKAIDAGLTRDNAETMEKLVGLYERMQEKDAERQYNAAFNAMQAEIPEFEADGIIPNRGKYLRFETAMHKLKPILARHGFSISFTQTTDEKRVTSTCHLRHNAGHSVPTTFAVRFGGKADTETQADCKASTTAQRYALKHALGLIIHQEMSEDADAALDGGTIAPEKAKELEERCLAAGVDIVRFLKFAGADNFSSIASGKLAAVESALSRKEGAKLATEEAKW